MYANAGEYAVQDLAWDGQETPQMTDFATTEGTANIDSALGSAFTTGGESNDSPTAKEGTAKKE